LQFTTSKEEKEEEKKTEKEVAYRRLGWVVNAHNFVVSILTYATEDIYDISFYF
jgi:hypothetical protein